MYCEQQFQSGNLAVSFDNQFEIKAFVLGRMCEDLIEIVFSESAEGSLKVAQRYGRGKYPGVSEKIEKKCIAFIMDK